MSDTTARISAAKDGPYRVEGAVTIRPSRGAAPEPLGDRALCRCGRSADKPFCDGTHQRVGVRDDTGANPAGKDAVRIYAGGDVTVLYNPRICSHAAVCVASQPRVFDPDRDPWIDPDQADARQVMAAVRGCPSGALRIVEGGDPVHLIADRTDIEVQQDGPLWITGPRFEGADLPGEGGTQDRYVLCRCGLSGNKPWCDGSHHGQKWVARDEH